MEKENSLVRNGRVAARWNELTAAGKHGHYETLFQIVNEEVAIAEPQGMKPGDIVFLEDRNSLHHRFWEIEGVFLGGIGQESLVRLRTLSENPGAVGEQSYCNTIVPIAFVQGRVFTQTKS